MTEKYTGVLTRTQGFLHIDKNGKIIVQMSVFREES